MDLQHLRAFVAIADEGGVGRAAERLNLSQPAVTRQIQALEATMGVKLFARQGRRVALTDAGADMLQRCRLVLADIDVLRERAQALKSGNAGRLKVGATPPMIDVVLSAFLTGYRDRNPAIDVEIVEDGGASLAVRLDIGELHLAYVPAGDVRFTCRLLYPIHVVAVMAGSPPSDAERGLEIARLAGQPLLVLRRGFGSRELFEGACAAAGIHPNIRLESASPAVVLALAKSGYGVAVLPTGIKATAEELGQLPLIDRGAPIGHWTMLAWSRRRALPPYARRFAEELATFARRIFPGREVVTRAPPLPRPAAQDSS